MFKKINSEVKPNRTYVFSNILIAFFGNFPTHNCHTSHNCICLINMSLLKLHCCLLFMSASIALFFKKNDTLSTLFNPFAQKVMKRPHLVSITWRPNERTHYHTCHHLPYQIGHHRFWTKLIGHQRSHHFGHLTIIIAQFYQLTTTLSMPRFSRDSIIKWHSGQKVFVNMAGFILFRICGLHLDMTDTLLVDRHKIENAIFDNFWYQELGFGPT